MKKNIIKATLVAAFALIAGYNVYSSQKTEGMSDLALANVEALADSRESGSYTGCTSGGGYCAIYWNGNCIFSSYSHYPY